MIYYANPSTEPIRDAMSRGDLGCIDTPAQSHITFAEWDVVADNGCFSDRWDHDRWFRWLLNQSRTVRFAVAPDVVADHDATLTRWAHYGPLIERHGFTPAFVAQNGCTPANLPACPVVFIGGTTEFKIGPEGWAVAGEAKRRGAWVHMGRVNSRVRLDCARKMGADSCDGTYLTYGPDVNLPRLLGWLEKADDNPMLWE